MSLNEEHIDQIILNKEYGELTSTELELIKEVADSESTFYDTKLMLASVIKQLDAIEVIEPSENMKSQLMADFKKARPAVTDRRRGLGFFFPSDVAFHKKPGVQFLAAAAIIAFAVTFFFNYDAAVVTPDGQVAQNTKTGEGEDQVNSNKGLAETSSVIEESKPETNQTDLNPLVQDKNVDNLSISKVKDVPTPTKFYEQQQDHLAESEMEKFKDLPVTGSSDFKSLTLDKEEADQLNDEVADSEKQFADATVTTSVAGNTGGIQTNAPAAANLETAGDEISLNEVVSDDMLSAVRTAKKDTENKKERSEIMVKSSQSLAENAPLIKLFYTAM